MTPKYPGIEVELSGHSGNAFMIIGRTQRAMRMAGVKKEELDQFVEEATSGDYDNVLQICMKWVTVS